MRLPACTGLIIVGLTLYGCPGFFTCSYPPAHYSAYAEPEYMEWDEFRASFAVDSPRTIAERGKIFVRGSFIYIVEPNQGVHAIDNSDPAKPEAIAFLKAPGCVDITGYGDFLYLDSFVDLLVLQVDQSGFSLVKRIPDVFPYDPYQTLPDDAWASGNYDKTKGVILSWK